MAFLTKSERRALSAVAETLVPALEPAGGTGIDSFQPDAALVAQIETAFERITSPQEARDLKLLLSALERSLFNGVLMGVWQPFSQMALADREALLATWATSRLEVQRKAFQSLKRLILFQAYTNPVQGGAHPAWQSNGYPGEPGGGDEPRTIEPTFIRDHRSLTCDVLVIGSGAGGGVIAGELSAAGQDVIVVEKGGYYAEADFTGNERAASTQMFEKDGSLTTKDTALAVLAGSLLGGGTTINWSASFRTPDHVLSEWANAYGLSDATSDIWQRSLDAVSQRMNINCEESQLNPNNARFADGLQKLGYHMETIPRNVKGCEDCGFCNYGCSFGAKQGTLKTYLQDAYERGTRIVVRANARRVLHDGQRATGAVLEIMRDDGTMQLVTVRAKVVVVSAGSIHTPAVLLRSGLDNPNIGAHLHLHPTSLILSRFDEPIRTWYGVPMSRVSKEFSDLDGRGYGVALEVAPAHPGLTAATLPWVGASAHKQLMADMAHLANVIVITRDAYGGRVELDRYGEPVLDYRLHPYDAAHLQRGLLEALKVHYAAGAEEIVAPHAELLRFKPTGKDSDFVRFLRRVEDAGLAPNAFPLFSAHQMSSARMAGSSQQGALKPTGESWEIDNLYVADGSAMPTATGVNPMVSIMATAHYIAQHIKAALN